MTTPTVVEDWDGTMVPVATDDELRETAKRMYERDGSIEIDGNAVISRGDDPGAYVQAWVWVYYSDVEKVKT